MLPGDILGQVYEQFLGKVIRLTAGHRTVIEEKPAVRKAGGVFYTPTYIVDTIVRRTLGKLLAGLTLRQVAGLAPHDGRKATPVRVADIACGSGSFLLGAYQFLLDWDLAAYLADGAGGAEKWATGRNPRLYQNSRGKWRLTIGERKRILLDHIYGVDIDPQAVEVTKLSLLLKVLEGEDEQTIGQQLALFPERALPDLGRNIKCGNSLVGPDFYVGQQMALLTDEEALRVNVFNWAAEFHTSLRTGGSTSSSATRRTFATSQPGGLGDSKSTSGRPTTPPWSKSRSLHLLSWRKVSDYFREGGLLGYIVSNGWLRLDRLRGTATIPFERKCCIRRIVDFTGRTSLRKRM